MRPATRRAVILAAGCGSRVRSITAEKPKCLMPLAGVPIIQRIIDALESAGVGEIVLVTGFGAERIREFVTGRLGGGRRAARGAGGRAGRKADIKLVHNPRWRLPNGLSLYAARRALPAKADFLVVMSDHLLPAAVIRKVAAAPTPRCVLAIDTNPEGVFDLSDATKVRTEAGEPVAIGKRLRKYNAIDCGLFRFDERVFKALKTAASQGDMSLSGGVRRLIAGRQLAVVPIGRRASWIDIDTPRAYRQAARDLEGKFGRGTELGRGGKPMRSAKPAGPGSKSIRAGRRR
ncbi:MAG: NTP transferase domain-containing protein [bacterium]